MQIDNLYSSAFPIRAPMDQPLTRGMAGSSRPISRKYLSALALGLVVVSGGLCLAMPFWGDQALFAVYARELAARRCALPGSLRPETAGYISLLRRRRTCSSGSPRSAFICSNCFIGSPSRPSPSCALRPYFRTDWAAPLVPVFSVVVHYLRADTLDLTQVEILVAFPLLVAWWLIDQAQPATQRRPETVCGSGPGSGRRGHPEASLPVDHSGVPCLCSAAVATAGRCDRRPPTLPDCVRQFIVPSRC